MIKLKKILIWVKHYWYFPLLSLSLLAAFIFHRGKVEQLIDVMLQASESHKKEVDAINAANDKETTKVEASAKKFSKEIQDIFSEENAALEKAAEAKEEREKDLQDLEMELLADEMKKAFSKKD
tara:strand:+ start:1565 stop:1936 length:372 start_codon:yes stop_codon:yes gene_type:complete